MSELTDLFAGIAESIRNKTGESAKIRANEFPLKIMELPVFDASLISDWDSLFKGNPNVIYAPPLENNGYVKKCGYMFQDCTNLLECNQLYDFSNITGASYMFDGCTSLTKVTQPLVFFSSLTSAQNMFQDCTNLKSVKEIYLADCQAKTVECTGMFKNCRNLVSICDETVEEWDLNCAKTTGYMFSGCENLTRLPNLLLSNTYIIAGMFTNCSNLVDIGGLTGLGNAFTGTENNTTYTLSLGTCTALSVDSLMNIANTISTPTNSQKIQIHRTHVDKLSEVGKYDEFVSTVQGKNWTINIIET